MSYDAGALKQDPVSAAVAVRTVFDDGPLAWGVMTIDSGSHYAAWRGCGALAGCRVRTRPTDLGVLVTCSAGTSGRRR